ncbi:MAG TPA: quinoprotein dehydrogenase-associated SoxYZ-like carrier [Aliidongia sp.]|uniref:quinoprotein dehydrogenase-associated SoxYZ-like carrier n=1 Tax=Aliidongia sp. TaxID=1914230 RepID=UPI002DDD9402|nr:quinoprotein dehydrogenase-associated SoxYZ-like carrier [Aliidongia sp.]HEV2677446.1 quinoprotein dehydrogenase-associated SoxYZ-like carrier [Aliidongia sp.]
MRRILLIAVLMLGSAGAARAEESDADRQARWQDLRHAVFGDRTVEDGRGIITLEAPPRALDAALVPITIDLPGPAKVTAVYLMIDENPSPLAGTFHFGPAADTRELRTRVRVDAYTLMHAVAETEDGRLFGAEKFVKAAGGCSAPSTKDQKLALERLGQMRLKPVGEASAAKGDDAVQLLISHPNFNGMQMDQLTRNYTPARFIQDVKVTRGDALVFDLEADISLSEDPAITFGVADKASAPITVEVHDSANATFKQSFDLPKRGT